MPFTDTTKLVEVVIATDTTLDASSQDVLSGKKFIGKNKIPDTGSIPVNDKRDNIQISSGESVNVPYGYNPSDYIISSKKLLEETPATAVSKDVLDGKTCWVNGVEIIGTMPNNNAQKVRVDCDELYTIPEGYHNGEGTVTGNSLASQTVATATSDDILNDKTAYVNGEELTGTMPNNGHADIIILPSETTTITKGYHDGTGTVSVNSTATALSEELVNGKTAWVNGEQITGSLPVIPDEQITLPINGTYTIPKGYHLGGGTVTQNITSQEGIIVTPSKDPQILNVNGKVMMGDITVSGVDAYIYSDDDSVVKDFDGNNIRNISIENGKEYTFYIFQDNWHDNNTDNIYHMVLLNDGENEFFQLSSIIKYNHESKVMSSPFISVANYISNITISGGYNTEKNCQEIKIIMTAKVNTFLSLYNTSSRRKYV
nr:MAG TPA: hypothetical protein [Caudoviricetes sp.]